MRVPMSDPTPEFWGEQEDQYEAWEDFDNPEYCPYCQEVTDHIEIPDKPWMEAVCEVCLER